MRIAAYCRVSTEKEEQQDSLKHQKQFFQEYAQKYGHTLVRLYADEGISGTSLKKRDQFLRLMEDARKGLFETVVVKDVSRLARNTVDFLQSIRTLKSCGVNTLFITANMDTLGESEFVLTLFGAMAQEESANLSRRVKFGKKLNAQKGRVPQRIFGYDRVDNFNLAVNPEEAQTVRQIFRLYLEEGLGCRAISLQLNAQGAKTKFGCDWDPRGVRRILTNSIYCGRYVNNKYEIQDYLTGKQIRIPEEQHYHHPRPQWAIVTPEEFDAAQELMARRRIRYGPGESFQQARYSTRHGFSTLIRCESCGQSFCRKQYTYANTRVYWKCRTNDQYTSRRCGNGVTVDERELLDQLSAYLASRIGDRDVFVENALTALERRCTAREGQGDVTTLAREKKRLLGKRERLQEMYVNDVITLAELKEKTAALTAQLSKLEARASPPPARRDVAALREAYTRRILAFLAMEDVTNLDLRQIVERVSVSQEGVVTVFLRDVGGAPAY